MQSPNISPSCDWPAARASGSFHKTIAPDITLLAGQRSLPVPASVNVSTTSTLDWGPILVNGSVHLSACALFLNFEKLEWIVSIPDICHFFYTHIFLGLKILHSKVRKFGTKIASQQNSVDQYWELHILCQITKCVYNYILCVKLHIMCKITHCV